MAPVVVVMRSASRVDGVGDGRRELELPSIAHGTRARRDGSQSRSARSAGAARRRHPGRCCRRRRHRGGRCRRRRRARCCPRHRHRPGRCCRRRGRPARRSARPSRRLRGLGRLGRRIRGRVGGRIRGRVGSRVGRGIGGRAPAVSVGSAVPSARPSPSASAVSVGSAVSKVGLDVSSDWFSSDPPDGPDSAPPANAAPAIRKTTTAEAAAERARR